MSEVWTGLCVPPTTYLNAHRGVMPRLPEVRYQGPSSFVKKGNRYQKTRIFPVIPVTPGRRLMKDEPSCYSLGCTGVDTRWYNAPKTNWIDNDMLCCRQMVSQTPTPPTGESKKSCCNIIAKLPNVDNYAWSTTYERAAREGALPIPKVPLPFPDPKADQAELYAKRRQKNRTRAGNWQQFSVGWNRCQMLPRANGKFACKNISASHLPRQMPKPVKQQRDDTKIIAADSFEEVLRLREQKPSQRILLRRCPGYAGYLPKSPVIPSDLVTESMKSVMKLSFPPFPPSELKIPSYGNKKSGDM